MIRGLSAALTGDVVEHVQSSATARALLTSDKYSSSIVFTSFKKPLTQLTR